MNKQNIITWFLLMVLTVVAGLFSNSSLSYTVPAILVLAILKFIGVSFGFMEMSKAHVLWKALLIIFLVVLMGVIFFAIYI